MTTVEYAIGDRMKALQSETMDAEFWLAFPRGCQRLADRPRDSTSRNFSPEKRAKRVRPLECQRCGRMQEEDAERTGARRADGPSAF